MELKIAVATDDGERVSNHFGRAPYYRVLTVADGQILTDERLEKPHHGSGEAQQHHERSHGDMFAPIRECQLLICGGMGQPAYQKAQAAGLDVFLVGGSILEAVHSYLNGEAVSDMRRIHQHHHNHQH